MYNSMECIICYRYLESRDFVTLQCNHKFCERCLNRSFHFDVRCPVCRRVITKIENTYPNSNIEKTYPNSCVKEIKFIYDMERIGIRFVISRNIISITTCSEIAKKLGFKVNQKITHINNIPCYNINSLFQILKELKGDTVSIHVVTTEKKKTSLVSSISNRMKKLMSKKKQE